MLLTEDNYKKFAAPYIGQNVFHWSYPYHTDKTDSVVELTGEIIDRWLSCGRLRLKHLSLLTEQDNKDIVGILFPDYTETEVELFLSSCTSTGILYYKSNVDVYLYLQHKGYLVTNDQNIIDNWVTMTEDEVPNVVGQ